MIPFDIIYLILEYCHPKTIKKLDKIIDLPSRIIDKLKYYKTCPVKCTGCNLEIINHSSPMYDYEKDFDCISSHRHAEEYYYCEVCQYFYFPCPQCSNDEGKILCQFLGFNGFFRDKIKYRILDKSLLSSILEKIPALINYLEGNTLVFNENFEDHREGRIFDSFLENNFLDKINGEFYDVSDLNLEFFDTKGCNLESSPYITHSWKCKNCLNYYKEFHM